MRVLLAGDKVELVDKNFVMAKAKLLGVNIENIDYVKCGTRYKLNRVLGDIMYLADIESGDILGIKRFVGHADLLLSKKLRVVNLWNNRYFSRGMGSDANNWGSSDFRWATYDFTELFIDYKTCSQQRFKLQGATF